jgi:hypothetical protein
MEDAEVDSPQRVHRLFIRKAANHVEALCNLTYLICEEAVHPEKVRHYTSLSEQSLEALTQLLREHYEAV